MRLSDFFLLLLYIYNDLPPFSVGVEFTLYILSTPPSTACGQYFRF